MKLTQEIGYAVSNQDYLIFLEGLPGAKINDICVSESGVKALVTSLEGNRIRATVLGEQKVKPGELFRLDSDGIRLPLDKALLGRVINPLGQPIDGKSALPLDGPELKLDVVAPGIKDREQIENQLLTGFAVNDILLPLAKGQRELIIGDPRSRKSAYLIDLIANQKGKGVICVYAAIGKPEIETRRFVSALEGLGALSYTTILTASSDQPAPLVAIAPSSAFSIAEYFCRNGQDVLLILNDLGTHAKYLREIALLSLQSPGRESYPGNIFYEHSHLIERAGRFKKELGGGSITLIPVLETDLENISNLIPTNLMSQTDGHLLFSSSLASQGQYPPIEWDRSVTRVGRQTQPMIAKLLGTRIRTTLAEYKDLERYTQFDVELSDKTRNAIKEARVVLELFNQETPLTDIRLQICLLALVYTSFFRDKSLDYLKNKKNKIIDIFRQDSGFQKIISQTLEYENLEKLFFALEEKSAELEKLLA